MKHPVIFVILQTGAKANGGLQSVTEVMRRLRDHRPIVVTNLEAGHSDTWREHGFKVHVVPDEASAGLIGNPIGMLRTYGRYYRRLRAIIRESGARVVHANDPLSFQLSWAAAKASKVRLLLNLRDTVDPARKAPRFKFRMIFAAADHVLYLSADMAKRWREIAPNATRSCSVTYSVVDAERFAPCPVPKGDTMVVLVPGIFWQKKGQLEFIRNVVPRLAAHGIESWFAGDFEPDANPYAAACAAAAEPFGDNVQFLGYRDDLPELMRQASVVAVPSRHEGLMRGMIEAMSRGRPVVSFDVCSTREVLEEKSGGAGTVVPQGDYAGMAAALIHYATDPDAQSAAGRAGSLAALELFNADRVVERYERVYTSWRRTDDPPA